LQKDIDYTQLWGDFSYKTIEKLKEAGYVVSFFTCQSMRFDPKWVDDYNACIINNVKSSCYFITVTKTGEAIEIEAERPKMPDSGLEFLCATSQQIDENIQNIENRLKEIAHDDYNTLEAFDRSLQDEFNYAKVVSQGERQVDNKVMFLEGWTTTEKAGFVEEELDKQGYFYQQLNIAKEDKMPVILKNNRYARVFEPLTEIFSLPNHTEIDPTPLLAPFFMLFFGFCFGDAGYGLLLLALCTVMKFKAPAMRSILTLGQWLGGTAIVVGGIVGGAFFGFTLVDISAFASFKEFFFTQDGQMKLALTFGLIHIVFGKGVAAYKTMHQRGVRASIAPWAWVLVLASLLTVFAPPLLSMFGQPLVINYPSIMIYICYGIAILSGVVILLFSGDNIISSFGSAFWNTYSVLSGLLGDTLSYIRLFALGLTGGILGGVFNMLAIDMTAELPIFVRIPVMLIILLLGHGLNIVLCMISSLVHPIRLIFVEYFKNSEYEGGGIAYVPFKKI
jgi:V/A-type H+-transporting ATPase subunit I